ncbi:MAG: tetratricopeptide repeat protein [Bacteroidota bacterium]
MKKYIIHLFTFIFVFNACFLNAKPIIRSNSNKIIDSLHIVLKKAKEDTTQVNTLNAISREYLKADNYKQALQNAEEAQQLAEKCNYKSGLINSYNIIGIAYRNMANYEKALDINLKSLMICQESGDKNGIKDAFLSNGGVYMNQGNYKKSYENYLNSLKISEELGDKKGIATSYNNIGLIFMQQNNLEKALDNQLKALKIRNEIQDKPGIAMCYNNMGNIYLRLKNFDSALDNYLKSLKIREESGDKYGIATAFNNIGLIYWHKADYQKALSYHLKSLKIREEIGDKKGLAMSYNNIGDTYSKQGSVEKAIEYLNLSLVLFTEIGQKNGIKESYVSLYKLYDKKGDYKQALKYHELFSDIKDSLLNEQSGKQIAEMDAKYESDEKEKNIELLTKDKALQQADLNKQKFIRNGFISGLILTLLLIIILYNRYLIKKKLFTTLTSANNELIQKNTLIEKQKEKIIDSITYAQHIQQSILIEESEIQKILPDSFVYYQPKDIVSGDFYWCSKINDKIILAAIDCTGHGVPGAFMSMIGNTLLNQIVNEKHITTPSEILRQLNIGIYQALHQEKEETLSRDGMDIALCSIDYKNDQLEYAGAQNPLYMVSDNELTVVKADRQTIGGGGMISKKENPLKREYTNHVIPIKKDMCIYLFSDGYMDQFRGSDRKKFGIQQFKDLILANQSLSMQKQKNVMVMEHENWKENTHQIDDILIIGLRL